MNIWEFLWQFFFLLHCSLWEQKSVKVMVKREVSRDSLLYHLLLTIYHDHCGSHQWKACFCWLLWCLCTLERSLALFLAMFLNLLHLHWLPVHLGHRSHPGISLHSWLSYEVFFLPSCFFFVRSLILALLPFDETYPSRLSLREECVG